MHSQAIDYLTAAKYNCSMMDYFDKLSRFERFTRKIIEGSFDKVLGGSPLANEIANEIVLAMDNYSSNKFIPNHFEIYLDDSDYSKLLAELPRPEEQFCKFVEQAAEETGTVLSGEAEVQISISALESKSKVRVICGPNLENEEITQAFQARGDQKAIERIKSTDAFLIVNGKRHVPLEETVLHIGRQLDNDLVIDDSTVSRRHAQIRWRFGRFVIHDVGSKAGTFVNGKPISESVLQSGDIVTLGKVSLIYGEDNLSGQNSSPNHEARSGTTRELRRDNLP